MVGYFAVPTSVLPDNVRSVRRYWERLHEKVQGRQTKFHPGFTMGKLVQPSPGISILRDSHFVLSKRS